MFAVDLSHCRGEHLLTPRERPWGQQNWMEHGSGTSVVRGSWISFVFYPESLPRAVAHLHQDLMCPSQETRALGEGRLEKQAWLVVACGICPHTIYESLKSGTGPGCGGTAAVVLRPEEER